MGIKGALLSIIRATREKKIIPVEKPVSEQKMLEGKVALISGGSGGIGISIAKELHSCGCKVIDFFGVKTPPFRRSGNRESG